MDFSQKILYPAKRYRSSKDRAGSRKRCQETLHPHTILEKPFVPEREAIVLPITRLLLKETSLTSFSETWPPCWPTPYSPRTQSGNLLSTDQSLRFPANRDLAYRDLTSSLSDGIGRDACGVAIFSHVLEEAEKAILEEREGRTCIERSRDK